MEVSVVVRKIYSTVFFPSGRGVDDVLVRLSLTEQIIKDDNLMCISFSVKHPHFTCSPCTLFSSASNCIRYCPYFLQ